MKTMSQRLLFLINWWSDHFWNFVAGVFFTLIAYFAELKGSIHVMWIAFVLDLIIGIWASLHAGGKFSMEKAFVAFQRMGLASMLVMLLFAMDKEMDQDYISMYKIISWLISGFLAYSIAENGFKITGDKLFLVIKSTIKKKVSERADVDIENP